MSIKYATRNERLRSILLATMVIGMIVNPSLALADDTTSGKNGSDPPARDSAKKINAPTELTERERWLLDEVEELKRRVAELESKNNTTATPSPAAPATASAPGAAPAAPLAGARPGASPAGSAAASAAPASPVDAGAVATAPTVPFAYADWTWLNGNARNKDAVWDSKYFTPEFRVDTNFIE